MSVHRSYFVFFCFICINECCPDNDNFSSEDEAVYSGISLTSVHYVTNFSLCLVNERGDILPCNRGYVVFQFE